MTVYNYNRMCDDTIVHFDCRSSYTLANVSKLLVEYGQCGVVFDQAATVANVDRCLSFVTSQHPQFDLCTSKLVDGFRNTLLQLVFNSSSSTQLKISFHHSASLFDHLLSVHKARGSIEVNFFPFFVLIFFNVSIAIQQGSQAFRGKVIDMLKASFKNSSIVHD